MNLTPILSCILLVMLNMISCEKEEEEPERLIIDTKIAHHLYQNCAKTPYANLDLYFYERHYRGLNVPEEKFLGSTTTDANGYFRFDPGFCQSNKDIFVLDANGIQVFATGCLGDAGYPKTDLTAEVNTEHIIKILTNKSFTSNDTLYLGISGGGSYNLVRTGPFLNNETFSTGKVGVWLSSEGYGLAQINYSKDTDAYWGIGLQEYNFVKSRYENRQPPNYLKDIGQNICGFGDTIVVDLRGY